jgi:hypothetical protein
MCNHAQNTSPIVPLLPLTRIHVVRRLMNGAGGNTCEVWLRRRYLGWVRSQPGRCGHAVGYRAEYYHRTRADFFIQVPTRRSMNEVALDGIHNTLHSNWHLSQHPALALAMSKLYVSAGASISYRGFGAHSRLAPHLRFMRMCRGTIRDACVNSAGWCAFHDRGPRKSDDKFTHSRSKGSYRGLTWRLQVKCSSDRAAPSIAPFPAL